MPNIRLQDVTTVINGTSRYNNNQYDICHVEMLLVTEEPLPPEANWYVPKQDNPTIPPAVAEIFKIENLQMYPQHESTLTSGLDDAKQQAINGNLEGVLQGMSKLMLLALLKKVSLNPIPGAANTYSLQYDYKLFPLPNMQVPTFEFYVELPFDTLTVAQGGRVQCTVVAPIDSTIEPEATKGIISTGGTIEEQPLRADRSRRPIVNFEYQNDPLFVVRYHY